MASNNLDANVKGVLKGVMDLNKGLKDMNLESEKAFQNMSTSISGATNVLQSMIGAVDNLAFGIGGLPGEEILKTLTGAAGDLAKAFVSAGEAIDSLGKEYRELLKRNYDVATSMGLGIEAAKELNDRFSEMTKINSDLAKEGLFIGSGETREAFRDLNRYLKDSRDEFLNFQYSLDGTNIKAEQMMSILSKNSGFSSEYGGMAFYGTLSKLIQNQGLTFEEAIKTMSSYKDMAQDTGLSVETISDSLASATSNFSKLGITVDFAKPALEGFNKILKETGLGISEVGELTRTLSQSLVNVGQDYGKAYVMFQQGGLDFGGGGTVLGSSLGFRASMMEQSPEEQQKTALDLTKAMRDTIANFTGGQIITLQEAAKNPALQTQYYAQEQMLGSMFGISDQATQAQTLSLLKSIDEAMKAGDKDSAMQLSQQLEEGKSARAETTSLQEKLGAIAAGSFSEHVKSNYLLQQVIETNLLNGSYTDKLLEMLGYSASEVPRESGTDTIARIADTTAEIGEKAIAYIKEMASPENFKLDFSSGTITEYKPEDDEYDESSSSSSSGSEININIGSMNLNKGDLVVFDSTTRETYSVASGAGLANQLRSQGKRQ